MDGIIALPMPIPRTTSSAARTTYDVEALTKANGMVASVVTIKPTTHGNLLCAVARSFYSRAEQDGCQARVGLDWHGFELSDRGQAKPVCTGGVLYDIGRHRPAFVVLAYGRTWRSHGFTCTSRVTGLTCTNGHGHGLFLSRESRRLW